MSGFIKCSNSPVPHATATVVLALGIGLALLRTIDPSVPITGLIDTVRLLTGQTF